MGQYVGWPSPTLSPRYLNTSIRQPATASCRRGYRAPKSLPLRTHPKSLPIPTHTACRDKEGLFIIWLDVLQKVTPSLRRAVRRREGAGGWVRKKPPLLPMNRDFASLNLFRRISVGIGKGAGGWVSQERGGPACRSICVGRGWVST